MSRSPDDKKARRVHRSPSPAKLIAAKSDNTGPGWIEGYASTWDNVDLQNEVMQRGCFARSIQQAIPARNVKLMAKHYAYGGDVEECIGTVTQAKEDDHGLFIHAELASTQAAQDVRTLILEGHVNQLSVGFRGLQYENRQSTDGNSVLAWKECALAEVTVTCHPANPEAEITGAKEEVPAPKTPAPKPPVLPRIDRELELARASLAMLDD